MSFMSNAPAENPNKSFEVASPPSDSISSLSFSPKANHLVATSWDNQNEFKRIVSPLKYQTRCVAAFPDQQ